MSCVDKSSNREHLKKNLAEACDMQCKHDKDEVVSFGASSDDGGDSDDISVGEEALSSRNPEFDFDGLREAMCTFVVSSGLSFSTSQKPGFKHFMSVVSPHFNLPTAGDLFIDALNYCKKERKIVEDELQRVPGRICLTVDNLKDDITEDNCMCLTAHWIDSEWIVQRRMIKFDSVILSFDGNSMSDEIILCLRDWKISDKVLGFTIDDPSYSGTLMASLRAHFQETNSLVLDGQFFHIRCAHKIINLAVEASLNLVTDILDKIRSIVQLLRFSTSKKEKFYEVASSSFGLNTSERLIGDTSVRWNSTFVMLSRFLYFQDAIDSFVSKDREIKEFSLTQEEWSKVTEVRNFLKVLYDEINSCLTSETPTANVYFHVIWKICMKLSDISNGPPSSLSTMAKDLQEKFDKYWSEHSCILSCAAVLDPRYKLNRVEFCYEKLYGEINAKEMIGKVRSTLLDLFEEYKKVVGKNEVVPRGDMEPEEYEGYVAFLRKKSRLEEKSELERYLEEWISDINEDTDVLKYWKNNSKRFPCLSCLARDILAIPISTAALKSPFSTKKNFLCPWRKTLSPWTMEDLVCYQDWLRAKGLSKGSPFYGYNDEDIEEGSEYDFSDDEDDCADDDEDEEDENEDEDEDGEDCEVD